MCEEDTCGPMGVMGIRKNIQAITGPFIKKMLPEKKCLVVVMVDGISIESHINVDIGSCRHCENNVFNSMDDAKRFQEGLKEGKFHVAPSETEVICLGLIHKKTTSTIPIAEIPTCKGDEYVGKSTHVVSFLLAAVEDAS